MSMDRDDVESVLALDHHLDALDRGQSLNGHGDGELAGTLVHLRSLADRPAPDPAFVQRLRGELLGAPTRPDEAPETPVLTVVPAPATDEPASRWSIIAPGRAAHVPRWRWRRIEIAAAILVLVVLAGYLTIAEQGHRAAQPSGITIPPPALASPPARLKIEKIGVEAPVEVRVGSEDEPALMPAASGPWVVAWREESAMPGEGGNVVLEGHLDSWEAGPAIFWDLQALVPGDRIDVIGENGTYFSYVVEWSRSFPLVAATVNDEETVLGPTATNALTVITAAGEFDTSTGYSSEVLVVRARLDWVSYIPAEALTPASRSIPGDEPVLLEIDAIDLDASVSRRNGSADPTLVPQDLDPLAAFWRDDSARLGEAGNVAIEGRYNQQWTRDAIFANLKALKPGDRIDVVSRDLEVFSYEVEWLRTYPRAHPTDAQLVQILGPTPEASLTLITTTDELDREAGWYRDVLVVRARFVSSAPLPVLVEPDASECQVAPRGIDEIQAVMNALLAEEVDRDELQTTAESLASSGKPVTPEIEAAVLAAEREFVACLNANDTLRTYALYTDDGLTRLLYYAHSALLTQPQDPYLDAEWVPDVSYLADPVSPRTSGDEFALLDIEDVRVLDDGRIAAAVTIGPPKLSILGVPTAGVPVMHVFSREGDRYLIDEFVVLLEPWNSAD